MTFLLGFLYIILIKRKPTPIALLFFVAVFVAAYLAEIN